MRGSFKAQVARGVTPSLVSKAVGSPRNQGAELIEAVSDKKSD